MMYICWSAIHWTMIRLYIVFMFIYYLCRVFSLISKLVDLLFKWLDFLFLWEFHWLFKQTKFNCVSCSNFLVLNLHLLIQRIVLYRHKNKALFRFLSTSLFLWDLILKNMVRSCPKLHKTFLLFFDVQKQCHLQYYNDD